jgi:hypothetical protein
MDPTIDLIWSVEEDELTPDDHSMNANCGCAIACCCSIPSIITKWICPNFGLVRPLSAKLS